MNDTCLDGTGEFQQYNSQVFVPHCLKSAFNIRTDEVFIGKVA